VDQASSPFLALGEQEEYPAEGTQEDDTDASGHHDQD